MAIVPNSDVILLKSPLELNQTNQLNFANATEQYNYFYNLPKNYIGDDYTYQRKEGYIRVDALADDLYEYNYVMYRNTSYSGKWFYAFIDRIEYVNDNCSFIYITIDVFQTWQFDLTYKQSFVEREHVNNDAIGANTIDEGLETGEYIINYTKDIDITDSQTYGEKGGFAIVGVSITPTSNWEGVDNIIGAVGSGRKQQGIPTALDYLIVNTDNIDTLTKIYDKNSKSDAIATVFVIPQKIIEILGHNELLSGFTINTDDDNYVAGFNIEDNENTIDFGTYISYAPSNINGYVPRNNKLFCYPYCYSRLTNNGGVDVTFRWEDFENRNASFKVEGSISQGMSIKAYPTNYMGTRGTGAYVYGVTAQKFPTCGWNSDFYLSWVNQQGANLALQTGISVASNVLSAGGSIAGIATSGNPLGGGIGAGNAILNTMSTIGNSLQRVREAELVPPQTRGNINSGDVNFSIGKSGFTIYDMNIKAEYARVIDEWFDMFGYKVNRVKVPNVRGRRNWNYIKTIGCYIEADIPQDDLQQIKNMFDNGITIWHNPNTFMDYSQYNPIV